MPSEQKTIGFGSGPKTTAEELAAGIDLAGKLAIVTGRSCRDRA